MIRPCFIEPLPCWLNGALQSARAALVRIGIMLFTLLLAKNLFFLAHAALYVFSLDTEANRSAVAWVGIGLLFLIFLLLGFFIAERKIGHFISLCLALVLGALVPSISWPRAEWKLMANKDAYLQTIMRDGSGFVVLEHKEEAPPLAGPWLSWLIFDESDETGLPPSQRSEAWKAKLPPIVPGICPTEIRHIEGHFYYAVVDCTAL